MKKIIIIALSIFPLFFYLPAMAEEADPNVSFLKGEYLRALENYEKLSERNDLVQYRIGICYLKLGKYEKAEEELKKVFSYTKSALFDDAQFARGEALYLGGNFAEAIKAYQQLTKEHPESSLLHLALFKLGMTYLKKGGLPSGGRDGEEKEALKYFKRVRTSYPLSFEAAKSNRIIFQKEGPFSIQIGAFVNLTRARNVARDFQKKGYDAYLLKKIKDKPWIYKVRIGNFKSRAKAILFTPQLPEKTDFFITKEE
ncbi:MAG: tetratricopeptide repeat protein [Candidatus Omnitrophica bacterium]|nr:tetratricopeptide repeat protein [Candidatus Omnitrophota bacterium]